MANPAFVSIKSFCKISGLSQYYVRQRVREGSLPFIRSGSVYLVNVEAALEVLDAESRLRAGIGQQLEDGK